MRSSIVLLLLLGNHAFAGKEVGNGGYVVKCDVAGKIEYKLLDYYEAEKPRPGLKIDLGGTELDEFKKVELVLSRIKRLSPKRTEIFEGWLRNWSSDSSLESNIKFIGGEDTGVGTIPSSCELEKVIQQTEISLPGDVRYVIKKEIWDVLPSDVRAGLILHEFWLRVSVDQPSPHGNTRFVRYMNSVVSSTSFLNLSHQGFVNLQLMTNIDLFESHDGLWLSLSGCTGDFTKSHIWLSTFGTVLNGIVGPGVQHSTVNGEWVVLQPCTPIEYNINSLSKLSFYGKPSFTVKSKREIVEYSNWGLSPFVASFYDNGQISFLEGQDKVFRATVQNHPRAIGLSCYGNLAFDYEGHLKSCEFANGGVQVGTSVFPVKKMPSEVLLPVVEFYPSTGTVKRLMSGEVLQFFIQGAKVSGKIYPLGSVIYETEIPSSLVVDRDHFSLKTKNSTVMVKSNQEVNFDSDGYVTRVDGKDVP